MLVLAPMGSFLDLAPSLSTVVLVVDGVIITDALALFGTCKVFKEISDKSTVVL